ncbi:MAG: molybdenum ABC transporter ATP-binding protein [Aeromonadaceae bacterium]
MSIELCLQRHLSDFSLDVSLTLPARGVSALFGPSGSGKTTVLRALAGLERLPASRVVIAGMVWQDEAQGIFVPPHRRALGYVFQEASLFAHLDVLGNLTFGMRRAGVADPALLNEMTGLLGIDGLLKRMPDQLSGGERQRVAVARALLTRPQLLLMDEPLSALDLKRKQEILPYLERLHEELAIPVVYVSHAPDEVARLADHLVLLERGRVVASGPLQQTLARTDLPPAFADDAGVVIAGQLQAQEPDGLMRLAFAGGVLLVPTRAYPVGQSLRCRIHARDVSLSLQEPHCSSILNRLPAVVETVSEGAAAGHLLVRVRCGETPILARITERSRRQLAIEPGLAVWVQIKGVALLDG